MGAITDDDIRYAISILEGNSKKLKYCDVCQKYHEEDKKHENKISG